MGQKDISGGKIDANFNSLSQTEQCKNKTYRVCVNSTIYIDIASLFLVSIRSIFGFGEKKFLPDVW